MGVSSSQDLCYYVLCVVREPVGESTVNLKCPIVIHAEEKKRSRSFWIPELIICATGFLSFDLRRRGLYADFASKGRRIACHRRSDQCDHPLGRRQRHRHAGHQCPKDVLILRSELQQAASVNLDSANVDCVKLVEDLENLCFIPDPSSCALCSIPDLCIFLLMSTMLRSGIRLLPQRVDIWVMYPCNRYSSKSMFTGFVPIETSSCLGAPNPY